MLIQIMFFACDGIRAGGQKCENRFLVKNILQPAIEAIEHDWQILNPKHRGEETKHLCPECQ